MTSKNKIYKLQSKLLNEIEQESQAIEKNVEILQKEAKKTHLRKRHRRPTRSRRILFLGRLKKIFQHLNKPLGR